MLGVKHTYPKQVEIFEAAATRRRIAVVGCNGSGKDWAAGRLVLWWMSTHKPAKAVVTGPTGRQVYDVVWKELRTGYYTARHALGGFMYQTPRWTYLRSNGEPDDEHFAVGFSTSDAQYIRGYHSPNLMVLVTEAHAMPKKEIDALRQLNPALMVMTGNPFTTAGEFYDAFHGARSSWHTIEISAHDLPNVQQRRVVIPGMLTHEDVEERKADWGEDSAIYRQSVLGQFVDDAADVVVPLSWARAAVVRETALDKDNPPLPVLGLDVARFGVDRSVLYRRDGPRARMAFRVQGKDTQAVAGRVGLYCAQNPVPAGLLLIDDNGVGGGVYDRLVEEAAKDATALGGWIPRRFISGAAARDEKRFANRITEAWWHMREWFDPSKGMQADIGDDPDLIGQVSTRGYEVQGDRRIRLEPKDKLAKEGRKSPDEADALAMTFASDVHQAANLGVWV